MMMLRLNLPHVTRLRALGDKTNVNKGSPSKHVCSFSYGLPLVILDESIWWYLGVFWMSLEVDHFVMVWWCAGSWQIGGLSGNWTDKPVLGGSNNASLRKLVRIITFRYFTVQNKWWCCGSTYPMWRACVRLETRLTWIKVRLRNMFAHSVMGSL